ncbi:hypothetical protein P154DRAFT_552559 [Amniculicola lignicola CBS 123094]|uniref:Tyrosine specific protein phosphatases domain-containing protein n=1 Tax=Amniculicola lignicola CBS 123094 TaxID=1392246 RepID=A0A6A5WR62_9PLEO|nr:hypothetical protein P154DRAFT_552559 [Amniculicola lignicola CBS 123094]
MAKTTSPLKTIPNFRDVGVFINKTTDSERLKTGLLFRGARPDEASLEDRESLLNDYTIKGIIDLRTQTEHIEQARQRDAKIKSTVATTQTNDDAAQPLKIPGITYHEINFNGSAFSRMLISKLKWIEFFRLIGLMLFGYRLDAIKILAPHMEKAGLVGLAIESLDVCTKEVKQVFDVYADEANWPVLVHCTQGKDRTGLTVMLLLFLLEVDVEAVEADYVMSVPELEPERAGRIKEIATIGLSERFADCPPDLVKRVHQHLGDKYGGIVKYLEHVGVTGEMMARIRKLLLASA